MADKDIPDFLNDVYYHSFKEEKTKFSQIFKWYILVSSSIAKEFGLFMILKIEQEGGGKRMKVPAMLLAALLVCTLCGVVPVAARRGRARGRTKSRVQIGLPITGKYRDPESDQYYNNNNVRTNS